MRIPRTRAQPPTPRRRSRKTNGLSEVSERFDAERTKVNVLQRTKLLALPFLETGSVISATSSQVLPRGACVCVRRIQPLKLPPEFRPISGVSPPPALGTKYGLEEQYLSA